MLKRQGFFFEFEISDDWEESRRGGQLVYHPKDGGELVVSGRIIEGIGSVDELNAIRDRLCREAINAILEAASHPELRMKSPLSQQVTNGGLDAWVLHSETAARDVCFSQAVVCGERGILLVTFESPRTGDQPERFSAFVDGIRYLSA